MRKPRSASKVLSFGWTWKIGNEWCANDWTTVASVHAYCTWGESIRRRSCIRVALLKPRSREAVFWVVNGKRIRSLLEFFLVELTGWLLFALSMASILLQLNSKWRRLRFFSEPAYNLSIYLKIWYFSKLSIYLRLNWLLILYMFSIYESTYLWSIFGTH